MSEATQPTDENGHARNDRSLLNCGERLLSLAEATKVLPRVNGKRPAISTLWRWCRKGLNGQRLEYIRMGRNIVTSAEALGRFFTALAEADAPIEDGPPPPRRPRTASERARQRSIEEANRILERAGI